MNSYYTIRVFPYRVVCSTTFWILKGVYTMIHVRRTCTSYRCTAYMYHSVNIHRTCTAYMCAVSNMLKTTRMYSVNSLRTCTPHMYHSINSPLYCLVTEAHRCDKLAQGFYAACLEPTTSWSQVRRSTTAPRRQPIRRVVLNIHVSNLNLQLAIFTQQTNLSGSVQT